MNEEKRLQLVTRAIETALARNKLKGVDVERYGLFKESTFSLKKNDPNRLTMLDLIRLDQKMLHFNDVEWAMIRGKENV